MKPIKIGILISSCQRQKGRMKKTLWVFSPLGYPVVLGYDGKELDIETGDINVFTTGEGLGKQLGEHRQILIGSKILLEMGCEYIFKTCGDIFVAKPFEIPQLVHKLGEYEFLCNGWDVKKVHFGTQVFFGKLEPLVKVAVEVEKIVNNKKDSLEVVFGEAMRQLGYKYKVMDDIDHRNEERLWRDGLGCEHLR